MRLYLMRHGAAVEMGAKGVRSDAGRMLSAEGIAKTKAAANGLRAVVEEPPRRIIASPLVRAQQTADIVAKALSRGVAVEISDALKPGGSPDGVVACLRREPPVPALLVGHMPDLSSLAAALASRGDAPCFAFKKSAVLCLEFEGAVAHGRGRVVWFLEPGMLRRLGNAT